MQRGRGIEFTRCRMTSRLVILGEWTVARGAGASGRQKQDKKVVPEHKKAWSAAQNRSIKVGWQGEGTRVEEG